MQTGFNDLRDEAASSTHEPSSKSGPATFHWRDSSYQVFAERQKVHIETAERLQAELAASPNHSREVALLEELSAALNEAKGIIRHSLAVTGGMHQVWHTFFLANFASKSIGGLEAVSSLAVIHSVIEGLQTSSEASSISLCLSHDSIWRFYCIL